MGPAQPQSVALRRSSASEADEWTPSTPSLTSRAAGEAIEVVMYLGLVATTFVIDYYLPVLTGPSPLSSWWIALTLMAIWNLRHWPHGQSPVGSILEHAVVADNGRPVGTIRMSLRQLLRFTILYALPFVALPRLLGSNPVLSWMLLSLAAAALIHRTGRAPWDFAVGTIVSHHGSTSFDGDDAGSPASIGPTAGGTRTLAAGDLRVSDRRVKQNRRAQSFLRAAGLSSVLVTGLIIWSIFTQSLEFVSAPEFSWGLFSEIGWFPRRNLFDLSTLLVGTLWVTGIAIAVAGPIGLGVAIYLSEYARPRVREIVKPVIETLASIPSVVLGFFAISFISPSLLRPGGTLFGIDVGIFSLVSAGIGVGILTVPIVASIAEDAMRAVPSELREASYGLGARRATTALRVVVPAALSGISAAFIVGISRAIGETMVVYIAAGGSGGAIFNANPLEPGQTITAAMASLGAGTDSVAGSGIAFNSLYFLGAVLFVITFVLNLGSDLVVRRFRQVY